MVDGVATSFSVYLYEYKQYFATSVANVSLANALLCSVVILQGKGSSLTQ